VIVKPWREPGYRHWVRVSIGSREQNDQFLTALSVALQNSSPVAQELDTH